jgi:spore coat polysaccharide biosynthesis protein SpsF
MNIIHPVEFMTEQEKFWFGDFGNEYADRNDNQNILVSNTYLFSKILERTSGIKSMIEFGCNIGYNIFAIKRLLPNIAVSAIEINEKAVRILKKRYASMYNDEIRIYNESILEFQTQGGRGQRDLSLIKGVLIHINPNELQAVYQKLYDTSRKYILIAEYYNPVPVELSYRGNMGKLFKRDFAGEMLDKFTDLKLIDYGFAYHRDNNFPADDFNWFLLEK